MHDRNIERGVSSESVRIGIESLQSVELERGESSGMIVDEGGAGKPGRDVSPVEDESDGSKEVESIRRSSRRSVLSEKSRAMEGDDEDDEVGDGEESDDGEGDDGKVNEDKGPREKTKKEYLPYDASKHFYWARTVRLDFFLLLFH